MWFLTKENEEISKIYGDSIKINLPRYNFDLNNE